MLSRLDITFLPRSKRLFNFMAAVVQVNVSLLIFSLEDPSIVESGVLKSSTITELLSVSPYRS